MIVSQTTCIFITDKIQRETIEEPLTSMEVNVDMNSDERLRKLQHISLISFEIVFIKNIDVKHIEGVRAFMSFGASMIMFYLEVKGE